MTREQVEAGGKTIKADKVRITETTTGPDYSGPFEVIQHSVVRPACWPSSREKVLETDQSRKTLFVAN
jgi:hypothetical protein